MFSCNCYALTVQTNRIHIHFVYVEKQFILKNQVSNSGFLSDAWHPLKLFNIYNSNKFVKQLILNQMKNMFLS